MRCCLLLLLLGWFRKISAFVCRFKTCLTLFILSIASALLPHTSANDAICRGLYKFGENMMFLNDLIMQIIVLTVYIPLCLYIQCVYKWMVQFQKLTRNLFLTLHGHNVHRQQRQLSKYLMRYHQFARSCLLRGRGASFQDGAAAGKGFLRAPFWGVQICDRLRKDAPCTVHLF